MVRALSMAIAIIIYGLSQHGFHSMLLMLKQCAKNTYKIANEKLGTKRSHEGKKSCRKLFPITPSRQSLNRPSPDLPVQFTRFSPRFLFKLYFYDFL